MLPRALLMSINPAFVLGTLFAGLILCALVVWLAGRVRLKAYEESETRLRDAFRSLSSDALTRNNEAFLALAEIARVLDVSESKVKVDIHRARMRLREKWNEIHEARAAIK
jgi:hypothetical protein